MKRLVTAAAVMIAASALTWAQGESNAPAGTSGPRQGFVSFDERFKQMDKSGNGVIDKD